MFSVSLEDVCLPSLCCCHPRKLCREAVWDEERVLGTHLIEEERLDNRVLFSPMKGAQQNGRGKGEIFNPKPLRLATLPLCFHQYLSSVCKWFSVPHKHGESVNHLNGRESKNVIEGVFLNAFQIKWRVQNPIHSVLLQCRAW